MRATRFAPTMRWVPSIASSIPEAPPSGGATIGSLVGNLGHGNVSGSITVSDLKTEQIGSIIPHVGPLRHPGCL